MDSYRELRDLQDGALVKDATGRIWKVSQMSNFSNEVWLCTFSDDSAFIINSDGSTRAPRTDDPVLPIVALEIVEEIEHG